MDETIGQGVGWGFVWGYGVELIGSSWRFGLLQYSLQRLLPVHAIEVKSCSSGRAVQQGIGGSFCRRWVVRRCDRLNVCGGVYMTQFSTDPANGHRHVVPAGGARIAPVHDSWQLANTRNLEGLPTGLSEVEGAGGTAHLVGDNTQLIPFTVEPEHG